MSTYPRGVPKYYQLAEWLRSQILNGELQSDDRLPIEDDLCKMHNLSRGTVREAVRMLIDEGLVRREQGRGTFVNELHPETSLFTLSSFNEEMRRQNRIPSTLVLQAVALPASPEVGERLALQPGEPVVQIVRLRLADGQPVVYETRYLAQALCPGLLQEDLEHSSIHHVLVRKYHIPLVKMIHVVEMRRPSAEEARLLQVPPEASMFSVDRLTFTERDGRQIPAVWFQALYHEAVYSIRAMVKNSL